MAFAGVPNANWTLTPPANSLEACEMDKQNDLSSVAKYQYFWQFFESLFSVWHSFESALANYDCHWANFD